MINSTSWPSGVDLTINTSTSHEFSTVLLTEDQRHLISSITQMQPTTLPRIAHTSLAKCLLSGTTWVQTALQFLKHTTLTAKASQLSATSNGGVISSWMNSTLSSKRFKPLSQHKTSTAASHQTQTPSSPMSSLTHAPSPTDQVTATMPRSQAAAR